MAVNDCSTNVYNIRYTDSSKGSINVNRTTLVQDAVDLTLLGQARKEYGDVFDENILHLLENFASIEDPSNPGNPYVDNNYSQLLSHPVEGQKWYNKSDSNLYIYNGSSWLRQGVVDDVAGNSGIIAHGEYIPLPISSVTGYQYTYAECAWFVSMWNFPDQIESATCTTNTSGLVTSQYTLEGTSTPVDGYAIYQIIGIRNGQINVVPSPTPTPSLSLTPSVTVSLTRTPQPTVTRTPAPSITPTLSPTPTHSISATPHPSPSYAPSPSLTPTVTPTPSLPITDLPINGNSYIALGAVKQAGNSWGASAELDLNFYANGSYSIIKYNNGISSQLYTGTWLPSGQSASTYTLQMTTRNTTQSNGTNGSASLSNSASSIQNMSTDQLLTMYASFNYTGASIPDNVTGGSVSSTIDIVLSSISSTKKIIATITMTASAYAGG